MNMRDFQPEDQQLWRRVSPTAPGSPQAYVPIDASDLAAYVDGKAGTDLAERIEQRLRHDPQLLDEVTALRQVALEPVVQAPAESIRRAVALVKAQAAPADDVMGRLGSELGTALRWWLGVRWTAAATLVIVACLGGYAFGQSTMAELRQSEGRSIGSELLDLDNGSGDSLLPDNGDLATPGTTPGNAGNPGAEGGQP
ncbi:MAG: hypothetical protein WD042_04220 [Phycisphaeraceae bacterium]